MKNMSDRFLIAGAGFSGAVLAHKLTELLPDCSIDIYEEKPHLAGNCFTQRDGKRALWFMNTGRTFLIQII